MACRNDSSCRQYRSACHVCPAVPARAAKISSVTGMSRGGLRAGSLLACARPTPSGHLAGRSRSGSMAASLWSLAFQRLIAELIPASRAVACAVSSPSSRQTADGDQRPPRRVTASRSSRVTSSRRLAPRVSKVWPGKPSLA